MLKSEWAEDLESMKMFVLEGKKFIVLPEAEKGVFYSESCYAFVCRYFFAPELPEGEGIGLTDYIRVQWLKFNFSRFFIDIN